MSNASNPHLPARTGPAGPLSGLRVLDLSAYIAGPYGCALLMWRYDDAFMSKSANVTAFKNVASLLNSKPRRSCRRP